MDLKDKVALVPGGTLGIGLAVALDFARQGCKVATVARHLGEPADSLSRELGELGSELYAIQGDLSIATDCKTCVEETVDHFGRLDILVHNAGGPSHGGLEEISDEQWLETMNLHVNANFFLCKTAVPQIRKQGEGAIITISSAAGVRGVSGALAYATAKGALPQFTRSLAKELGSDNIRVNCVAPGVIRTRFHDDMTAERKKLNLEHRIPLAREGTSKQVAEVVTMLATNDYITGETIVIDGGLTSRIA